MAGITLNAKPGYQPELLKGEGYREIGGKMAQTFLRSATWTKANAMEYLQDRVVTDSGARNTTYQLPVYKGKVQGRTVGLVIGEIQAVRKLFGVRDDEIFDSLLVELNRNHGFLDQQAITAGDILTDNNANALYAWEGQFFGYSQNLRKIWKTSGVSTIKTKKVVEGTNAEILSMKEGADLIAGVCKKYEVYNLELEFGPFDGNLLGYVKPTEDGVIPGIKPVGVYMYINKDVIYKHTILHELAHAIELFHNGLSAHGKGFRAIYRKLLVDYMKVKPVGL